MKLNNNFDDDDDTESPHSREYRIALQTLSAYAKNGKNEDALQFVCNYINKTLEYVERHRKDEYKIQDALDRMNEIAKVIPSELLLQYLDRILKLCNETPDIEFFDLYCDIISKLLKYCPEESFSTVMPIILSLISAIFQGNLPSFEGHSIFNDMELELPTIDSIQNLLVRVVSIKGNDSNSICSSLISLVEKPSEKYRILVIDTFIDGIQCQNISQEVISEFMSKIPLLCENPGVLLKQDIVYLFTLLLRQYPFLLEQITPIINTIQVWFDESQNSQLSSNFASLFLVIATLNPALPIQIIDKALNLYPPNDISEINGMTQSIFILLSNQRLNGGLLIKSAIGLAKIATEQGKKKEKMKIIPEIQAGLISSLKALCSTPENLQAIKESISYSQSRLQQLEQILAE